MTHAAGTIVRLLKRLGDPVRTGDTLAFVESRDAATMIADRTVAESKAAKQIVDQTRIKPQGTVRISCPVALLSSGIGEIISLYLQDNPQVQVLVDATNRRVDVTELIAWAGACSVDAQEAFRRFLELEAQAAAAAGPGESGEAEQAGPDEGRARRPRRK